MPHADLIERLAIIPALLSAAIESAANLAYWVRHIAEHEEEHLAQIRQR